MKYFSYRSARSGSLVVGICIALLAETLVIHLWLTRHHPIAAWVMTFISISTLVWVAADHAAMGKGAVGLDDDSVILRIGNRFSGRVARGNIARAVRPSWQEIPAPGSADAAGFLNLTKPATPNILIVVRQPVTIRVLRFSRRAGRIGLHLDDPDEFLAALG